MPDAPDMWMPRERWDALVRGEDCPLCAECRSAEEENAEGFTVARLRLSQVRLQRNQYVAGYAVLICARHVVEPHELAPDERDAFFDDLARAGRALARVFAPIKLNYQMLGNLVPHLHAHVVPRYYGDPAPGRPIDPGARAVALAPAEYAERVRRLREALAL
jgi:diadenosine tetraphosphate (Ap4A) HIT family hydrolase